MKYSILNTINRNLAFLVIVAVLPALAILLYTGIEQRHTSIKAAEQSVLLLTHSMAEVQRDITLSCRQILSTLSLLPEVQSFDQEASSEIFAAVLAENPGFHNIALTDLNGTVLAAGKAFKAINLGDRKHVRDALAQKAFAGGEYIETRLGTKAQVFPFAYPVCDRQGTLLGALTIAVDLALFTRFYEGAALPALSFIAATDSQGIRLIYYPAMEDTNPIGKPIKAGAWKIASNAQQPGVFIHEGSDDTRRIFAFEQIRLHPDGEPYMYMWAGIPETPTLIAANKALTRNLLLMLLTTALALLVAWTLGRNRLIVPLQNLVGLTHKFAKGELALRSELSNQPNEFGTLTRAFNDMANSLAMSQKAMRENEARFRTVMDSLDALVYVADMDSYEILFINEYVRKLFGNVIGKTCWQHLQHNQSGPCPFCTNKYLLKSDGQPGKIYTWEFQNTFTGNWYQMQDRAIKWIDGRIVRLEIATDISKIKLTETKLAEQSERLAVTLRSIGDGVITTDTEGRILLLNQVAEGLTGWDTLQAAGHPLSAVFRLIDEKTGQPIENLVEKLLAEKVIGLSDQTSLIDKNGLKRRISNCATPIQDGTGKVIGIVLVFRDITEQLRTEQELIKVKKLESIGVLAGGIAHDFNNILASILGNIDLTLRDPTLSEKTRQRLTQSHTASLRARDLTQQLLTFAKGGQPIKETASLTEIVKESADFVLRGGTVACRYNFPADLWLVDIDKGQISQVIQNIIINASNAMPNGGLIELTGENIDAAESNNPALAESEYYVKLDIRDTGAGIPVNLLDKIFDPYFTTKQQGSGLGLAITHSIINKHGGTISVQSTPGEGSTFTIHLPASQEGSIPFKNASEGELKTKNARILVMDDEEIVRNIVQEMLIELGHEVVLAKDGAEAIQIYQTAMTNNTPIDLLVMDLTIPGGMGGKDAIQQLLAIDNDALAIVSSGYSNDPVMAEFADYGFAEAIVKPYQLSDLNKIIHQLLSK